MQRPSGGKILGQSNSKKTGVAAQVGRTGGERQEVRGVSEIQEVRGVSEIQQRLCHVWVLH